MVNAACLDISGMNETIYGQLYAQAAPERKARADGCRRREDAFRCIAADALLRYAVRKALPVTAFTVEKSARGKPRLKGQPGFCYNLSHSGKWVAIAWGETEVGIDVEEIRMDTGKEAVARRHFTPEEQAYVFQSEEGRGERFFRVWTGKESYLKYLGTGLTAPLNSFSVLSAAPPAVLHTQMLDGCCLTLCAEDSEYSLELLNLDSLLPDPTDNNKSW